MVFQNYALYPHMTVAANMGFSLKLRGAPAGGDRRARERAPPRSSGSAPCSTRYPRQLSGGQRQRVAMGRAIVRDPQVFLFDEPLSNLDAKLRVAMRTEIKELHQRLKTTTVYVTHDQIEAMTMADRIVVMHDGIVEQIGAPLELYDRPQNLFVAGFIGSPAMNFLKGAIRANGRLRIRGRRRRAPAARRGAARQRRTRRSSTASGRSISPSPTTAPRPRSRSSSPPAPRSQVVAKLGGEDIIAVFRERHAFKPGDKIRLKPDPRLVHLFDAADRTTPQRMNNMKPTGGSDHDHVHPPHPGAGRHRARRNRRARRLRACSNGRKPGRRPRRGSRKRAPSSRCCAGNISCNPRTTPSWRCSMPSPRRPASRSASRAKSLRGHPAEGLGRGQYQRRPGPVLGPVLAAAPVPAEMRRRHRRRRLSRQEIRRLGADRR